MNFLKAYILFLFSFLILNGQEILNGELNSHGRNSFISLSFPEIKEDILRHWNYSLKNSLLFNQLLVDNWVPGGVNSYSGAAHIDYNFHYIRKNHRWDSRILAAYGLKGEENDNFNTRKTEDELKINTIYRYNIKKNWYFGGLLNLETQFAKGYEFNDAERKLISETFSPGYLTVGLGLNYVFKDKFELNLSPGSTKTTFVYNKNLRTRFKLDENSASETSLGLSIRGRHRFKLFENVDLDQNFGIYSEYNSRPFNLDIAYQLFILMKINNFMSTKLTFSTLYDEDQIKKMQVRESLGVGFFYQFKNNPKKNKATKN